MDLAFTPEGQVLAAGQRGIRLVDPESGASTWIWTLAKSWLARMATSNDAQVVLAVALPSDVKDTRSHPVLLFDRARQTQLDVTSHGSLVNVVTLAPSGRTLVTGDAEGAIRAGPVDGEPHLLLGHSGVISGLAVSPDGKWIASASGSEIRLWPTPDVTKPPLHTLPYDELMAKLRTLTNLQVVEDPASPTGYKLDVGPFPGWKDVPTW